MELHPGTLDIEPIMGGVGDPALGSCQELDAEGRSVPASAEAPVPEPTWSGMST